METPAFLTMLHRMIAAAGRRLSRGDPDDLAGLIDLRAHVDAAAQVAVDGLRDQGWSWEAIGRAAGMTRQSAYEKWSSKP